MRPGMMSEKRTKNSKFKSPLNFLNPTNLNDRLIYKIQKQKAQKKVSQALKNISEFLRTLYKLDMGTF